MVNANVMTDEVSAAPRAGGLPEVSMDEALRVLHLEDDEVDGALVARTLQSAGLEARIMRVETRRGFMSAIGGTAFDAVLSDFSMPDFDGLSALAAFRQQDEETPFIFVSGTIGEERAVQALRLGATDYVLKDRLSRLPSALERSLGERRARQERRLAYRQIHEQAALLDAAREAIVVEDLDGRITYWNRGAENVYGWSAEEAMAGQAEARATPQGQRMAGEAWRVVLAAGQWDGVLHQRTRDGREIVMEAHWTCLRDENGLPRAVMTVASDVTQMRAIEAQLMRSQRLEAVGMVAGGVAHDLNNVLAPILIGLSSLKRKLPDESSQRLLAAMETGVERGAAIVRQVVTFARGQKGEAKSIDAADVIHGAESLLRAALPRKVALELAIADGLHRLSGDVTQLQQVLLNLCINARDAMPGGGTLRVKAENVTRQGEPAGDYVCLSVADTGEGMPPEVQERVFEPFFTTKTHGNGIGLATVASIVKRHGGTIELDSTPGQGTEFRIFIPAAPQASPGPRPASPDVSGAGRLLLVLEEGSFLEIVKGTLEAYGYRVLCATNAEETLEAYRRNRAAVAAVLANLSIPGVEPVELVRALAREDPQVKVLSTSGLGAPLADGSVESVVRATLARPYSADKLLEVVHQVLDTA